MDINKHERLFNVTLRHKVKEKLVVRKDIDVNVHETIPLYTYTQVRKQLVVRKDMDVNELETMQHYTYTQIKVKE